MRYWILEKDFNFKIKAVISGDDPLYGDSSWNLASNGSFSTYTDARIALELLLEYIKKISENILERFRLELNKAITEERWNQPIKFDIARYKKRLDRLDGISTEEE